MNFLKDRQFILLSFSIIIVFLFSVIQRFAVSGYLNIFLFVTVFLIGIIIPLIFEDKLNAFRFILINSIIGFKVSPDINNTALSEYIGSFFGEYDQPSIYIYWMNGLYLHALLFRFKYLISLFIIVLVALFFTIRFSFEHYYSIYQEINEFILIIFLLSITIQFFNYIPQFLNTNKIANINYKYFKIIFSFALVDLIGSSLPLPWVLSFRDGISGLLSGSEVNLSYLILLTFPFLMLHLSHNSKYLLMIILTISVFFTYNKSALILILLIPLLYIMIIKKFNLLAIYTLAIISVSYLYFYSAFYGDDIFFTLAGRVLSITAPLTSFFTNPFFGIAPSLSSLNSLPAMNIIIFENNLFEYFNWLNNNNVINETFVNIALLKYYDTLPPIGPHIFMFQLLYSLGIIGLFLLLIYYIFVPFLIVKIKFLPKDRVFTNLIVLILILFSFFHPVNIIFPILILLFSIENNECNRPQEPNS